MDRIPAFHIAERTVSKTDICGNAYVYNMSKQMTNFISFVVIN